MPCSSSSASHRLAAGFLAVSCAVFAASSAGATGTRTFDLDTLEKLSGGDLKGVGVSSDGGVRAGLTLGNVPLPETSAVYSAVTMADGSVLVGTSPNGKVIKVTGDQATVYADTGQTAVTSLVVGANGIAYAATIPDGKIFKISAAGKADVLATLPDVHNVWALAWDAAKTALYAATGPDGKVFRVGLDGSSSVYFTSTEPNLVSLAVGAGGKVYAGSQGKGLLYEITGPGRATVLEDFPETEVKGVAVTKDGTVYAIANEYGEPPEVPKRGGARAAPAGPVPAVKSKPGKGSLHRVDATGRPEKMMHHDDTHYLTLAIGDDGQPYVGTGAEGRVYTVNDAHAVTLVADLEEHAVGAIAMDGPRSYVVGSDPGVLHRVIARGGADAVWTSKVLDCGLRARFGVLSWTASGKLELSTRSGSSLAPDATWSAWSAPMTAPSVVASPAARFVQVRARWGTPQTVLTDVVLPFVTVNVRPVVTEITAAAKGFAKEPAKDMPASGAEPPKHDTHVKLTWKAENPDNDALRYRVWYRREGQAQWRDALEGDDPLSKAELDWDTQALPEGKYRVRVEASDEAANPPGAELANALESSPITIDNTPPVITELAMAGRILRARVVDGATAIAHVAVAVDGKPDWRPVGAKDGVFDSTTELVDQDVTKIVPAGSHVVAVRAFDAAGNAVTKEIEAR